MIGIMYNLFNCTYNSRGITGFFSKGGGKCHFSISDNLLVIKLSIILVNWYEKFFRWELLIEKHFSRY